MYIKKIRNYQIFSVIFTFVLGTILHFTYEWSGGNKIVAAFSAVNESTWEHLKLLYFPMLITTIIGYFYIGKEIPNYLCAKVIGVCVAISFTVIFFYTYTGILGKHIALIDIASFFIAAILGEYTAYRLMINMFKCNYVLAVIGLIVLEICFIIFTFNTPKIGLFKDPVSGEYGIVNISR